MELALYEPELGYYRQAADRPTDEGDFLTAPELHPIFGWTLARRIERLWHDLGEPKPFWLIEHGAGSGTLGLSIFEGLARHKATRLRKALRYRPIEQNPHRLADLQRRFEEARLTDRLDLPRATSRSDHLVAFPAPVEEEVPVTGVLLANEFLDALPVHRLIVVGGWLLELYVTWKDGFVEVPAQPSNPGLARRLRDEGIEPEALAEGQILEICLELEPWLRDSAASLARGFALILDYGAGSTELYGPRHYAGTLLGYRGHQVAGNPFESVGLTDLTAHVDFTAVASIAERLGLDVSPPVSQADFLMSLGLEAEFEAMRALPESEAENYLRARSAVVRLLDPRHLGGFRVMTLEKGEARAGGSGR